MALHGAALAAVVAVAHRQGRLRSLSVGELALGAVASHKVSRLLAKASVTSPLRAPFTELEGPAGNAELRETVRGEGLRHAIGELVTCPFCLAQWSSAAYAAGVLFAPRVTRYLAALFAIDAGADALHHLYGRLVGLRAFWLLILGSGPQDQEPVPERQPRQVGESSITWVRRRLLPEGSRNPASIP